MDTVLSLPDDELNDIRKLPWKGIWAEPTVSLKIRKIRTITLCLIVQPELFAKQGNSFQFLQVIFQLGMNYF